MCVCVRARGEKIKSDCKIRINRGENWGVGLRVERLPRAGSGCKNPVEEICGGLGLNWKKKGRFSQRRSLYPSHHRRRECRKKERQENSKQIAAGHGTSVADCGRNRTTAEGGRGHQRHRHQTKKNPLKSKERRRFFSCPSPCQVCVCVCECVCVRPCLSVCVCVSAYVCEGCESAVDFLRWNRKPSRHRRILWRKQNTGKPSPSSSSSTKTSAGTMMVASVQRSSVCHGSF